jgi:hypothetical protein
MDGIINRIAILLMIGIVAGCGGSGAFTDSTSSSNSGGSTGSTGGSTSTTVSIGSGTGSSFTAGTLSIGTSSLSAGGTTTVTATLVDSSGNPYADPVDVSFVSTCVANGTATLTSPVTTVGGVANSTYVAKGCSGTDTITATVTISGSSLSATGVLTVAAASVGSIQFVAATPNVIAITGTGGVETSTVVFKVVDQTGGPVSGQDVDFSLDTTLGGLSLTPTTAKSGADGLVQTVVQSGTVKTGVRVTATLTSLGISTRSDSLVVSTALADEDSFSLSASKLNIEGWDYDGETSSITARLADRYNNPVPDGTAVSFYAEGGSVVGSCTTTNGACSVDWTSQNPRPSDGRVTVLAVAKGEESFVDTNSNGVFDSGDTFTDISEAYEDDNENGSHDSGELFVDQNKNGIFDGGDGLFNGVLCQHPTLCSSNSSINVWKSLVLVMSGSGQNISFSPSSLSVASGTKNTASTTVSIFDARNQLPPAGTTIKISTGNGTLQTSGSYTVPNSTYNGPYSFTLSIAGDGSTSSGLVTVTVTTPKGLVSYGYLNFND